MEHSKKSRTNRHQTGNFRRQNANRRPWQAANTVGDKVDSVEHQQPGVKPEIEQKTRSLSSSENKGTQDDTNTRESLQFLQLMASMSRRRSIFSSIISPIASRAVQLSCPTPAVAQQAFGDDERGEAADLYGYEDTPGCRATNVRIDWRYILYNEPEKFQETGDIKFLLELGLPRHLRSQAWAWLAKRELTQKHQIEAVPVVSRSRYDELVHPDTKSPSERDILADIGRTLTSLPYFSGKANGPTGQASLFNILKAYSLIDPEVGYCQGMSFIAGVLLVHSSSEYEALSLFLSLMFGFKMRSVYLPHMEGLKSQMYTLTRLMDSDMPELLEHLTLRDVTPDMVGASWLLTLFSSQFPIRVAVRIFDLIFYNGYGMIFHVIYKLLAKNKAAILETKTFEETVDFFQKKLPVLFSEQFDELVHQVLNFDIMDRLHCFEIEFGIFQEEKLEVEVASFAETLNSKNNEPDDVDACDDYVIVKDIPFDFFISNNNSPQKANKKSMMTTSSKPDAALVHKQMDVVGGSRSNWALKELTDELCGSRLRCAELANAVEELQAALVAKEKEVLQLKGEIAKLECKDSLHASYYDFYY